MVGHIEDYALISDCMGAALVGRDGSIDWLCWPRFDSPACFAALLGTQDHGRWLIRPRTEGRVNQRRRYRGKTFVLETDFETDEGAVTLIDFMSMGGQRRDLLRLVVGKSGQVAMRSQLIVQLDYGDVVPWVNRMADGTLRAIAGPDQLALRTPAPLRGEGLTTASEFTVATGETVPFILSHAPSHLPLPTAIDALVVLAATEAFWTEWAERCQYDGPWADAVVRSHLVLKALTYAPTGGIVAAPTTSLPEWPGGTRNWDYRFCWLRNATFSLLSLMNAGYFDEAQAWRDWLLRAVAGTPSRIQVMYGLAGERALEERELAWLPGYEKSLPVRVGNAAHSQLQFDVYGEVMDTFHHARRAGLEDSKASWGLQQALISHLETIWREPDEGIWEMRSGRRHFTHSKVMAWVALDRVVRSAEEFHLEAPLARWRALRKQIHDEVCRNGYSAELGSFTQRYAGKSLDASLLLIPLVGFLPPEDIRVRNTVRAIEQRLLKDGLVFRYDPEVVEDGLPPGEGAFLACSFWLADNLVLLGRHDDARNLFERLLELRNDIGLLAEEYDPRSRHQLGNFPHVFSHLALADTARNLTARAKPARQRSADGISREHC